MKILVIDDDEALRRTLTKVLRAGGHEVETAENGLRGMALLGRTRPQLGGSHLGGVDLLQIAQRLGADEIIDKPFSAHELLERVRRLEPGLAARAD